MSVDLNAFFAQGGQKTIQILHPEVRHEAGAAGVEIVGVFREDRPDGNAGFSGSSAWRQLKLTASWPWRYTPRCFSSPWYGSLGFPALNNIPPSPVTLCIFAISFVFCYIPA
jgi:hypothetical protein